MFIHNAAVKLKHRLCDGNFYKHHMKLFVAAISKYFFLFNSAVNPVIPFMSIQINMINARFIAFEYDYNPYRCH